MTSSNVPQLKISCSPELVPWLQTQYISLAFTTYQTNRLFLIGCNEQGRVAAHERLFDKPMGMYAVNNSLYISTRYQIWRFDNCLAPGERYQQSDRLYIPRTAYTTGDLNVHDVVLDDAVKLIFVNTDFSCLATISNDYSFVPLWQPPFISKLAAEDRCHLNGLAMRDGQPAYVTACSTTDTAAGWRNHRVDGGVVIDVQTNDIIATGLSMPHSPRWYGGKLWLLNSGTGELGYIQAGQFLPVTFCPGFGRGLAFWDKYAVVGNDQLLGGNGDDVLVGGLGSDILNGGDGSDRFVYNTLSERGTLAAGDTINAFSTSSDRLDLTQLVTTLTGFNGNTAGYLQFAQSGANALVQIDADGGGNSFVNLATLTNTLATSLVVGTNVLV